MLKCQLIRRLTFANVVLLFATGLTALLEPVSTSSICQAAMVSSPRLNLILPRGVQRGGEYSLKFSGQRLQDAEEIFLYDSGITVESIEPLDAKNISVKIKVADDCRLGEHVAQVRTRSGISDFRSFFVGALPEVVEAEPNSSLADAQHINLDVTVTGAITNEDIDYFRIEGKQGQRVSLEIEAIRLGFMFDPAIALLDKNRFEVAVCDDSPLTKQDSIVSVILPADGEYYVTVRESSFRGNPNCRYRLHVGQFARPVAVYPAGGKADEHVSLQFIDGIRDKNDKVQSVTKELTLPAEKGFRGGLFYQDDKGVSPSPLPFRLSPLDNFLEQEPNNTFVDTPTIELPQAINGIIETEGDRDFYRFHAKQGQVWHFECFARRIGSGLDPVINIYDANKKSIAGNDDAKRPDSYIRFQTPADGDYFLRVRDHLKRGRPDFIYRVEVSPAAPELKLGIKRIDRYSQIRQTIAVPRGNRFAVLVNATRKDFGGEIELVDDNLPAGITMTARPMKANLNVMPVIFEASSDAALGGKLVDFVGRHVDPAKNISGSFENRGDFVLGQPNNSLYYACTVDKLAMAVIEPVPFKLELAQPKVPMVRNGSIQLKVIAHRDEGFDGPINLQFPFRPPGVGTKPKVKMPKGVSEAIYPLNANGKAQLGSWPMYVIGTANVNGPAFVSTQLAELEIAETMVKMDFERASCDLGQTTNLNCKIEHLTPFEGEASATILGIPANVTIKTPQTFTKDTSELNFEVQTTEKSPVGKHGSLICQVTIMKNGEPIVGRTGNAVLRINKPKPAKPTDPAAKPTSQEKNVQRAASN
jgi:hypothetical protein